MSSRRFLVTSLLLLVTGSTFAAVAFIAIFEWENYGSSVNAARELTAAATLASQASAAAVAFAFARARGLGRETPVWAALVALPGLGLLAAALLAARTRPQARLGDPAAGRQ